MFTKLRLFFLFTALTGMINSSGQTLGGRAVYSFLNLPSSGLLSATGGVNVSFDEPDAALALNNPALLKPELHSALALHFNALPANVKAYTLSGVYQWKDKATLGIQVFNVNYGEQIMTDVAGNEMGRFRPNDLAVQLSASRTYLQKWSYGISLKLIASKYGTYSSTALAVDGGLLYKDSAIGFTAGFRVANAGGQLKTFAGTAEDLPFDVQAGVTQRLAHAPFAFSFTAHHLHRYDLAYRDPDFDSVIAYSSHKTVVGKLFDHAVIAAHVFLGEHLDAHIGYNALRRSELNLASGGNGLNGFSIGVQAKFPKLQVTYARSNYQRNVGYNQLGITLMLNRFFGENSF